MEIKLKPCKRYKYVEINYINFIDCNLDCGWMYSNWLESFYKKELDLNILKNDVFVMVDGKLIDGKNYKPKIEEPTTPRYFIPYNIHYDIHFSSLPSDTSPLYINWDSWTQQTQRPHETTMERSREEPIVNRDREEDYRSEYERQRLEHNNMRREWLARSIYFNNRHWRD